MPTSLRFMKMEMVCKSISTHNEYQREITTEMTSTDDDNDDKTMNEQSATENVDVKLSRRFSVFDLITSN